MEKTNTEGYRSMTKVDKRTAEDIKHRLPCITPSVQLKGNSKKLTDFRKETYWLMPIRHPRISHFRKFCFGDFFYLIFSQVQQLLAAGDQFGSQLDLLGKRIDGDQL